MLLSHITTLWKIRDDLHISHLFVHNGLCRLVMLEVAKGNLLYILVPHGIFFIDDGCDVDMSVSKGHHIT